MGTDTSAVVLAAEDRRAVADALRIVTRASVDRPVLRSVIVRDGLAMVTDTYVGVTLPTLAGLPEGAWSADALAMAAKGAGRDALRIAPADVDTLRVDRIDGTRVRNMGPERLAQDYAGGVPPAWIVGTFYVGRVDDAPPNVAYIYREAVADVEAEDYTPELVGFSPDRIADVLRARPSSHAPGMAAPVRILPRGLRGAVVTDAGKPYAVLMPMRDA